MKRIFSFALSLCMAIGFLIPVSAKTVYKITIDLGEGTFKDGKHSTVIEVEEGASVGASMKEGATIYDLNEPDGLGCAGFALGDEKEVSFNGEELDFLKPGADMVIKAIYSNKYTITLDYNGSSAYGSKTETETVLEGRGVYVGASVPDAPNPSDAFAGWSTKKTGDPEFTSNELEQYNFTKDTTLYAIYKPAVTITLDAAGGMFYPEKGVKTIKVPKGFKNPTYGDIPDAEGKVLLGWATSKDSAVKYSMEAEGLADVVFDKDMTLYAVWRDEVPPAKYSIAADITMYVGETVAWPVTMEPADADYAIISISHNASVAKQDADGIKAFREGVAEIEYMFQSPKEFKEGKILVTVLPAEVSSAIEFGFVKVDGKKYWYEDWKKQGIYGDPKNIWDTQYGKIERGREIYDPESKAWYWLDAVYDGAAAYSKEVWMPYVFQDEIPGSTEGKWVRYDENGGMIKGWYTVAGNDAEIYKDQAGNTYYYDLITGAMAKGQMTIDGKIYDFDPNTGVLQK